MATIEDTSTTAVAKRYFDAIQRREPEAMGACWKPGTTDTLYGMAELRAPEEVSSWFSTLFAAFPDFDLTAMEFVTDGEKVAVHWTATGTFNGDARFEGLDPNGASIELSGLDLLTVRDGLIVDNQAYTNGAEMARQLGAFPPAGSGQEKAILGALNMKTRVAGLLRRK
jgi:predicted ester cyclase